MYLHTLTASSLMNPCFTCNLRGSNTLQHFHIVKCADIIQGFSLYTPRSSNTATTGVWSLMSTFTVTYPTTRSTFSPTVTSSMGLLLRSTIQLHHWYPCGQQSFASYLPISPVKTTAPNQMMLPPVLPNQGIPHLSITP